ncbi:MAG: hypothetical protein M0R17_05880 [Candidatus Omnitrophica bacterium]|jgi:hypothetical protein|nr:hypothetical protein [Candidatus Omnitrophota bacterium]
MTIKIIQLMKDIKNPTMDEAIELSRVLDFCDRNSIDVDLDPPEIDKQITQQEKENHSRQECNAGQTISDNVGSSTKYEVVKIILIKKLLDKYKDKKHWIEIFPELEYEKGLFSSIYFVDMKERKEIIYHITKQDSKIDKRYDSFVEKGGLVIVVNINKLSDNIKEIEKELGELI